MSLIKSLEWRYATKLMNGNIVPEEKLTAILNATNLAATSYGLQPFKVLVVSNTDIKAKMQAAAYNQPQIRTSSHILVFAINETLSIEAIEAFINNVATTRAIPTEALEGYKQMMINTVGSLPAEQQQIWSAKQAYIALGTALAAAAEQEVDACPMEGFDAAKTDEILGLKVLGLKSVVILPLGFRAAEDATANYKKVRKANDEMFTFIN